MLKHRTALIRGQQRIIWRFAISLKAEIGPAVYEGMYSEIISDKHQSIMRKYVLLWLSDQCQILRTRLRVALFRKRCVSAFEYSHTRKWHKWLKLRKTRIYISDIVNNMAADELVTKRVRLSAAISYWPSSLRMIRTPHIMRVRLENKNK